MTAPEPPDTTPVNDPSLAEHLWCATTAEPIAALITFVVAGALLVLAITTLLSPAPHEPPPGELRHGYTKARRWHRVAKWAAIAAFPSAIGFIVVYVALYVRLGGGECGATLTRVDELLMLWLGLPLLSIALLAALTMGYYRLLSVSGAK